MSCRLQALWWDGLVVTDPAAVHAICARGEKEGALDQGHLYVYEFSVCLSFQKLQHLQQQEAQWTTRIHTSLPFLPRKKSAVHPTGSAALCS